MLYHRSVLLHLLLISAPYDHRSTMWQTISVRGQRLVFKWFVQLC